MLGMSAGFSQNSIAPGPDDVANLGSFTGGMVKIGYLYLLDRTHRKFVNLVVSACDPVTREPLL